MGKVKRDWAREKVEQLAQFEECDTNKNWVPTVDVIKLLRAERRRTLRVIKLLEKWHTCCHGCINSDELRRRLK